MQTVDREVQELRRVGYPRRDRLVAGVAKPYGFPNGTRFMLLSKFP
jgi:hypothetical protein